MEKLLPGKYKTGILLFFLFIFSLLLPSPARSQNFTDDYHSLRPFPFKPTNLEVSGVIQCGNAVYAHDVITVGSCCLPDQCCTCYYDRPRSGNITIDFKNSELPIVGNTEDVRTSQDKKDQDSFLTEEEKVNRYVSWYLNGVINRAEYSSLDLTKDCIGETTQRPGVCLNTNAAGACLSPNPIPLRPDIPSDVLMTDGKNSCTNSQKSCCVLKTDLVDKVKTLDRDKLVNFSGPLRKLLPQRIQDDTREQQVKDSPAIRHNQIVACTYGVKIPVLGIEIGAIPLRCLDLGWFDPLFKLFSKTERKIDDWEGRPPPKREEYDNFKDYYQAYRGWRGDTCLSFKIPLTEIELMLCFDNPAKPNFYGDLYPYLPFSSTEDRVGAAKQKVPPSLDLDGEHGLSLSDINYAAGNLKLYYAHLQEDVELSDLLKKSFVPQEGTGGEGKTAPAEISSDCRMLDVRTNVGDHLVDPNWSIKKRAITGDLSYIAHFSCSFCGSGSCTVYPVIPISLSTQNPLHDELWHNLVEGADSIFRKFFPKTGDNTPVTAPKDIPGVAKFEYSSNKYTVSSDGEIYFPHLGGISEYFLKGIQTALRPKGYGEPISPGSSSGLPPSGNCSEGTGPCSVANLLPYFGNDNDKATKASKICNRESGSNPNAKNDGCLRGSTCDYSLGLFQINLLAHCPGAFSGYSCNSPIYCTVGSQSILQACESRLLNPIENIKEAVKISNNGTNWAPWSAAAVCGIQ